MSSPEETKGPGNEDFSAARETQELGVSAEKVSF